MVGHDPGVFEVSQDIEHRNVGPHELTALAGGFQPVPLVFQRRRDPFGVEFLRNLCRAFPTDDREKDFADDGGCIFIRYHPVFVCRVLLVPIGDMIDETPFLHACLHSRADFDRQIPAVILIDKITEGNVHTAGFTLILFAVVAIIDGNDTHAEEGEDVFQVVAYVQVVPPKTGKVLYNDAADLALLGRLDHRLKLRPVRVCAGQSVVNEFQNTEAGEFLAAVEKFCDYFTLVADCLTLIR